MSAYTKEERALKVRNFICKEKEMFQRFIPRDKVEDISVSECVETDQEFKLSGSVGATSPTGKEKTYRYSASILMDESDSFAFTELKVSEL